MDFCKAIKNSAILGLRVREREKELCSPYDFLNPTQFDCFVGESGVNPTLEGGERGVVGWGGINCFLQ